MATTKTSAKSEKTTKTAKTKTAERRKPAAKTAAAKTAKTTKTAAKTTAKAASKTASKTTAKAKTTAAAETTASAKKQAAKKAAPKAAAKAAAKPAAKTKAEKPKAAEAKPAAKPKAKTAKPAPRKLDFKVNDHIVYPAHGVGRITGVEEEEIAGMHVELFVIEFEQEKMKLRVPTAKAKSGGMRALSSVEAVESAIKTLKGRARIKRTMWSRRAQEYEAKINSGNLTSIAEVVRDLYRSEDQPEQSYSERQLFESALDRMAREVAAVHKIEADAAIAKLEGSLHKNAA